MYTNSQTKLECNTYNQNDQPYGNAKLPTAKGASGGGEQVSKMGGRGGGVIWIRAPTCKIDGKITAGGSDTATNYGAGAGAGGSIYLKGATLEGSGIIMANGGSCSGTSQRAGGGSGGRVATLFSTKLEFASSRIQAYGGDSAPTSHKDRPGSGGTIYELSPGRELVRSSIDAIKGGYLVTGGVQLIQEAAPDYHQSIFVTPGSSFRFLDVPPGTPIPSGGFTTLMSVGPHVYLLTGDASTQPVSVISTTSAAIYPKTGSARRRLLDSSDSSDSFESFDSNLRSRRLEDVVAPSEGMYKIAELNVMYGATLESGNVTVYQDIKVIIDGSMNDAHSVTIGSGADVTFGREATVNHPDMNTFRFKHLNISAGGKLTVQDNTSIIAHTITIGDDRGSLTSTLHMLGQCNISAQFVRIAKMGHINGDYSGYRPIRLLKCTTSQNNHKICEDHIGRRDDPMYEESLRKTITMINTKKLGGSHGGIGGQNQNSWGTMQSKAWEPTFLVSRVTHNDQHQTFPKWGGDEVCSHTTNADKAKIFCGDAALIGVPCKCQMRGYGDYKYPRDKGLPGSSHGYKPGGNGGGAVSIEVVGTMELNGKITVRGLDGGTGTSQNPDGLGGGAGGSVLIMTGTFKGNGEIMANGGNGGIQKDTNQKNDGGGGGGGRVSVHYTKNEYIGIYDVSGGYSYVHSCQYDIKYLELGLHIDNRCRPNSKPSKLNNVYNNIHGGSTWPNGGGSPGSLYTEDSNLGTTSMTFDNYGKVSDYPTYFSNPFQLNTTLTSFYMKRNASISLHPENVAAGAKSALDVSKFEAPQGCIFRIGKNAVLVVKATGASQTMYEVETQQSVLSKNQYKRITSAVYYLDGEIIIGAKMIVDEGGSFIAPPNLAFREGQLDLHGSLSTSQLVLQDYSTANFYTSSSTSGLKNNRHVFTVLRVTDGAVLNLPNGTRIVAERVVVGGTEGTDPASIVTNGVVFIETEQELAVLKTGHINGRGKGYVGTKGPGGSLESKGGGSHGGRGGLATDILGGPPSNGNPKTPLLMGSGGYSHKDSDTHNGRSRSYTWSDRVWYGSEGGGAVSLFSKSVMKVYGTIRMDGDSGYKHYEGGGSGGSIWIRTQLFEGDGILSANGGAPGILVPDNGNAPGGGGGGRVSINCTVKTYTGVYQAYGGSRIDEIYTGNQYKNYPMGAAGTVYENCGIVRDTLTSSVSRELGGVLILKGLRMDVVEGSRTLTVTPSAELRLRSLTFDMELEPGYVGLVDQDGGVTLRQGRDLEGKTSNNNIFSGKSSGEGIDTKFQLDRIEALPGSIVNSGKYLKFEKGVLVIEGMIKSSLKNVIISQHGMVFLSATAFTETQKPNVFITDSIDIIKGGNLTVSPHVEIQVNTMTIGDDDSLRVSTLIIDLVATLKVTTKLHIKKSGFIDGKGKGLQTCIDNHCAGHASSNLISFNAQQHGKMQQLKQMGGTHGGVGGGRNKDLPIDAKAWGKSLCFGKTKEEAGLICGPGVEALTTCNCSIMGYGSYQTPRFPGSSGTSIQAYGDTEEYGAGGAALHIVSDTVIIDGLIDVSGLNGGHDNSNPGGGGAGGSVWIEVVTFQGSGSVLSDGGDGGIGRDDRKPFKLNGGGGGGGRISIVGSDTYTFSGTLSAKGGDGHVHTAGDYGYTVSKSLDASESVYAFPTGGGGAGTIHIQNNGKMGDLILDNDGVTSDHPTALYNSFNYNISLDLLKLSGNTSVSYRADGIVPGSSVTLRVGKYDDEEGSRLRLEDQTIFMINAGELGGSSTKVSTTQSLRSPSEFLRTMETVFYVGGKASLKSRMDVMFGSMLVVPPILTLTRANIQIYGTLLASQVFLHESTLNLHTSGSTGEQKSNFFTLNSLSVEDESQVILHNASVLNTDLCVVGGVKGSGPGYIRVSDGRTKISTGTFEIHHTGELVGVGYSEGKGPGVGENQWDGGSHGGFGGDANAPLKVALGEKAYNALEEPTFSGSGGFMNGNMCNPFKHPDTSPLYDLPDCSSGGAAFHLLATKTLLLDGNIVTDGFHGPLTGGGGGAGGSVWLDAPVLKGTGSITSIGGNGFKKDAGGGGGGRISVNCVNMSFTGSFAAYGGIASDGYPGSAGSIYNNCGKFKGYLMSSVPTDLGGILVMKGVKLDIKVETDPDTKQVISTTREMDIAESGKLDLRGVDPSLPIHDGRPFDKLVSDPNNNIYLSEGITGSLSLATIVGIVKRDDEKTWVTLKSGAGRRFLKDTSVTFDIKRLAVDRGSTVVLPNIVSLLNFTLDCTGSLVGMEDLTIKRSTVDLSNMFIIDEKNPNAKPRDLNLIRLEIEGSTVQLPTGGRVLVDTTFKIKSFALSLFDPKQKENSVVSYSQNMTLIIGNEFSIDEGSVFESVGGGGFIRIPSIDVLNGGKSWNSIGGSYGGQGGDHFGTSLRPEGWEDGATCSRQKVGEYTTRDVAGAAKCLEQCHGSSVGNGILQSNGEIFCQYSKIGCFKCTSPYASDASNGWNLGSEQTVSWKGNLANNDPPIDSIVRSYGNPRWPVSVGQSGQTLDNVNIGPRSTYTLIHGVDSRHGVSATGGKFCGQSDAQDLCTTESSTWPVNRLTCPVADRAKGWDECDRQCSANPQCWAMAFTKTSRTCRWCTKDMANGKKPYVLGSHNDWGIYQKKAGIETGPNTASIGNAGGGGGALQLYSASIVLNGKIDVSGSNAVIRNTYIDSPPFALALNRAGGGGSGGSVLVVTDKLSGNGWLVSNGGDGSVRGGGGGGGGRIAIHHTTGTSTFIGNVTTFGGSSGGAGTDTSNNNKYAYTHGGAGTVYWNGTTTTPMLVIDNAGIIGRAPTVLRKESKDDVVLKVGALTVERNGLFSVVSSSSTGVAKVEFDAIYGDGTGSIVLERGIFLNVSAAQDDVFSRIGWELREGSNIIAPPKLSLIGTTTFISGSLYGIKELSVGKDAVLALLPSGSVNLELATASSAGQRRRLSSGTAARNNVFHFNSINLTEGGRITTQGNASIIVEEELIVGQNITGDTKGVTPSVIFVGSDLTLIVSKITVHSTGIIDGRGSSNGIINRGGDTTLAKSKQNYGSHGGMGSTDAAEWGKSYGHGWYKSPTLLGSSGTGTKGGQGGGILSIEANVLHVDGTVTCAGEDASGSSSGGGSGGSMRIKIKDSFVGGGGVTVSGGNSDYGGGGGGGRMSIESKNPSDKSFQGTIDACGGFGTSNAHGSAGTLYFTTEDRLVVGNCGRKSPYSTILSHDGRGNYTVTSLIIRGRSNVDVRRLSVTPGFEEWLDIGTLGGDYTGTLSMYEDVSIALRGEEKKKDLDSSNLNRVEFTRFVSAIEVVRTTYRTVYLNDVLIGSVSMVLKEGSTLILPPRVSMSNGTTIDIAGNIIGMKSLVLGNRSKLLLRETSMTQDTAPGTFSLEHLIIEDAAVLELHNMNLTMESCRIGTDADLIPDAPQVPSWVRIYGRSFVFAEDMWIWQTGKIIGKGLGYPAGAGPGTLDLDKNLLSGACHSDSCSPSCSKYGNGTSPGSGAAIGGGDGGAAFILYVKNLLRMEGEIDCSGSNAVSSNKGGGSGGSISLTAHEIVGVGNLTVVGLEAFFLVLFLALAKRSKNVLY